MTESTILFDELPARARRLIQVARRVGMPPEEFAERALACFPPPAAGRPATEVLDERVAQIAASTGLDERVVRAAAMLPEGRAAAFEAVAAAGAFRGQLAERHGGLFPDSTPLIRADRDR